MSKIAVVLAFVIPLSLVGCGGGSSQVALLTAPNSPVPTTPTTGSGSTSPTAQTIAFSPSSLALGSTVTLQGVASSGLSVTYASQTPSTCSISGVTVTGLSLGACTLTANQAGNASFTAAPQVSSTFAVLKAQTITGFSSATLIVGGFTVLNPTSISGLPITISSLTPTVCLPAQNIAIYALTAGVCKLSASQAGSIDYAPAVSVVLSTTVTSSTSLAANAVLAPWITTPQAGSTADDSTTSIEGVYNNASSGAFALIDGTNHFDFVDYYGGLFGEILQNSSASTWVLSSSSVYYPSSSASASSSTPPTANGSYVAKSSFIAAAQSFTTVGSPITPKSTTTTQLLNLIYTTDNGFPASLSNVAGSWVYNDGTNQFNLNISSAGVISGTQTDSSGGACNLSGSISQTEPTSQHNMYSISLQASNASGAICNIDTANPLTGLAAFTFLAAGANPSNGYIFALNVLAQDAVTGSPLKLALLQP